MYDFYFFHLALLLDDYWSCFHLCFIDKQVVSDLLRVMYFLLWHIMVSTFFMVNSESLNIHLAVLYFDWIFLPIQIAAFPLLGSSVLNKSKDSPDLITPIGSTRMHMFQVRMWYNLYAVYFGYFSIVWHYKSYMTTIFIFRLMAHP